MLATIILVAMATVEAAVDPHFRYTQAHRPMAAQPLVRQAPLMVPYSPKLAEFIRASQLPQYQRQQQPLQYNWYHPNVVPRQQQQMVMVPHYRQQIQYMGTGNPQSAQVAPVSQDFQHVRTPTKDAPTEAKVPEPTVVEEVPEPMVVEESSVEEQAASQEKKPFVVRNTEIPILYSRADVEFNPRDAIPYQTPIEEEVGLAGFRGAVESRPAVAMKTNSRQWGHIIRTNEHEDDLISEVVVMRVPTSEKYKVVCYFESWSHERPDPFHFSANDVKTDSCTHLIYTHAGIDMDNSTIVSLHKEQDITKGGYKSVTFLKHKNPDLKVMISVGGWNEGGRKYSKMVSSKESRGGFIRSVTKFIEEHNFDGLEISWEYPGGSDRGGRDSDKENLSLLVQEMRSVFRERGWVLSAAVAPARFRIDQGYDVKKISQNLDFISVMTYDLRGYWDANADHHAPISRRPHDREHFETLNVKDAMQYWADKGADKRKLILGVPFYARTFKLKDPSKFDINSRSVSSGSAGKFTNVKGMLAFYEVCKLQAQGFAVTRDEVGSPYAYKNEQWIGFDDEMYIAKKMDLVKDAGYGGAAVYALGLDDFSGSCGTRWPLLTAVTSGLTGTYLAEVAPSTEAPPTPAPEPTPEPTKDVSSTPSSKLPSKPSDDGVHHHESVNATEEEKSAPSTTSVRTEPTTTASHSSLKYTAVPNSCTNDGSYSRDPTDCSSYYVCDHGENKKMSCDGQLVWNKKKNICDWNTNVKCKPVSFVSVPEPSNEVVPATTLKPQVAPEEVEATFTAKTGEKMVVCYFTNWAWYRQDKGKYMPADIDATLCTHIVYGFAVLDPNQLTLKPHDTWADYDNHFYEKVANLKSKGKKVTLALGGWNDSEGDKYSRLVGSAASRNKFIEHVVPFIQKFNFDGLDLDWEYPVCWQVDCSKGPTSDKENFAQFVRELSAVFKEKNLLLSAAVSPSKKVIDAGYDVPVLSEYLDWIAVMTYDYHGQWDKKTGHVAPSYPHPDDDFSYFNMNFTINYWIEKGASKNKLVLGMPLYGQSFTLSNPAEHGLNAPASGGGAEGEYTKAKGFLAYYEICKKIQINGWEVVKDTEGRMGPYAYSGDQWVSFDDTATITSKSQYIMDQGLAGAMVWALDLDDFNGVCGEGKYPLLSTINYVFSKKANKPDVTRTSIAQTDVFQNPWTISPEIIENFVPGTLRGKVCDLGETACHETNPNKFYQCTDNREKFVIGNQFVVRKCMVGTVWTGTRCKRKGSATTCIYDGTVKPETIDIPAPVEIPEPVVIPAPVEIPQPVVTPQPVVNPITPPPTGGGTSTATGGKKVVCYFTNWAMYRRGIGKYQAEDIDYTLCTHIVYGFAVLKNGKIGMHDPWADESTGDQYWKKIGLYEKVVALKQYGVKVVLALGGWNDSKGPKYADVINNPSKRAAFNTQALDYVLKYGFDGLDLDYEYPACPQTECKEAAEAAKDKMHFAHWLRELSALFKPRGLLLTAAVTPNPTVIDAGYDVPMANQYLDWIAVMAYDYHGAWDKATGHNAPMYHHPDSPKPTFNANASLNYWIDQGASPEKIIFGMPTYGRSFLTKGDPNNHDLFVTAEAGKAGKYTAAKGFLAYYEICLHQKNDGWTKVDGTEILGPIAHKGHHWVGYDDAKMIKQKTKYILDNNLGGAMIWALDLDDFKNVCGCETYPLLKTINRGLGLLSTPDPGCGI